ncbi:MAG: hypothetical protein AAGF49_00080, partial [Pseudomonadota bacterium]
MVTLIGTVMTLLLRLLCGLFVCFFLAMPLSANAQSTDTNGQSTDASAPQTVEPARPEAYEPPPPAADESETSGSAADPQAALDSAAQVRIAVGETLAVIPHLPSAIGAAVEARSETHPGWLGGAIFLTLASVLIAGGVWYFLRRRIGRVLARLAERRDTIPAYRTSYVLTRSVLVILADIAFVFVGVLLIILFVPDPGPARMTAIVVLLSTGFFLIFRDIFVSLYLPHRPQERVLALSDEDAKSMLTSIVAVTALGAFNLGLSNWAGGFGVDERTHDALRIVASGSGVLLFIGYFIFHRRKITPLVRG